MPLHYLRTAWILPPASAGAATERNATRWVERRLRPWMQRRMAQMRRAEAALNRVDGLGLSRQSVAAAALRGELQHDLARDLMQLDVPGVRERLIGEMKEIYDGNLIWGEDLMVVPVDDPAPAKMD